MKENEVVGCLGRPGSGKSSLLWRLYTSKRDRVVTLGLLEQDLERDPDVIVVRGGLGPLLDELKAVARWQDENPGGRWHIATALNPEDWIQFCLMLAPPDDSTRRSLAAAFGGLTLAINELYDYAPNNCPPEVKRIANAGRHHRLNIYAACQRPANCSRDFTASADHLYLFAQSEANDVDYIARTCGKPVAALVSQLGPHDFVHYDRTQPTGNVAKHYDGHGRYVQTLSQRPVSG